MPLRECVHVTHDTWLNDSFRAMCQVRVKDKCQVVRKVGKWGEASPLWSIRWIHKKIKGRKKKK